ncbi:unnamed protein product [Cunninghamella echinulata]
MPSNFPKEWIHSSYGFSSNFFNQFLNNENNTTNSNQENSIEANKPTTGLHEQQDQYNDNNYNNTTPTQQEKQRLVINDNNNNNDLLNQYSSFDDREKITSTKYQISRDPPYLSKPTNSNVSNNNGSNNNGSNIITTEGEENEKPHIKSAPRTNSIDSNHAVMNAPLSMDSDNNNNKTHGNYLPMGHNRDEEIKIMPTKTMPGTFSLSSDPSSSFNSILRQLQQQPTTIEEASSYQHDQQMNMAIKSAIDSVVAGSALSPSLSSISHNLMLSSHEPNQLNTLNDPMPITPAQNIKKDDTIDNINNNEQQQSDELHPLINNNNNNNNNDDDRDQLQQNPTTITDPFQFEKKGNGLNDNDNFNDRKQRRKSLPSNQCAAALPVLGSYVPFAQGTAVTFNSRERHNAESQRRLSTDRRYSLHPETLNQQQQQHGPDESATNRPNRRNSINVASLARFFHFKKKSN